MRIGILADTHDNLPKLAAACEAFRERRVALILHAGDFVAPFAAKLLVAQGLPIVAVFGNNDGERAGLLGVCADIHEAPYRWEAAGRAIVLAHDPEQLRAPVAERADLLVHGHTHKTSIEQGPPMLINPGEAGGWLTGRCTAAVVDLESMEAELIELGRQETVVP